jgi:hypothetical protein
MTLRRENIWSYLGFDGTMYLYDKKYIIEAHPHAILSHIIPYPDGYRYHKQLLFLFQVL